MDLDLYTMCEETEEMMEASYKAVNTAKQKQQIAKQAIAKQPTGLGITASQGEGI